MKRAQFVTLLTLLFVSTLYLPTSFAQDYTKWSLPDGAIARLGKGRINQIAYFPNDIRLAVASSIGIWIYDTQTGDELDLFMGHTGEVNSISFSPDGQTIVSGSSDRTIRIWDANTGDLIHTFTGHSDEVISVSFSPDGKTIASGSYDHTIHLWDVNTCELLHIRQQFSF